LNRLIQAFSLIEICIALGIVAFAFVALLGLLPVGLGNYTQAINTQTAAEIYQRIAAELQETEFDTFMSPPTQVATGGSGVGDSIKPGFFRLKWRYFDVDGQEVKVENPETLTSAEKRRVVYSVWVRGSFPGLANPKDHTSNYFTSLPSFNPITNTGSARYNPRDLMFFLIQVAYTNGREINTKPILDTDNLFCIDTKEAAKAGVPVRNYSVLISRNGYNVNKL
jgi:uncharacterized protein (TIGR02598 family)